MGCSAASATRCGGCRTTTSSRSTATSAWWRSSPRPTRSSTPCWRSSRCPTRALLELLRRRGLPEELDGDAIGEIAAQARGNPRAALRAANGALVTGERPGSAASRRAELLSDARGLGRPHGMLMSELLDLGQASPSDEALQARLGLSRARITTLLRQLLEAGLVSNGTDRTDAPGRPKTMYRPRLEVGE